MARSKDPWSPRQVTLRLRMPAPQVTEHCKDRLSATAHSNPEDPHWVEQLEAHQPGMESRQYPTACIPFPGPERLSHFPEVTQPDHGGR